MVKRKGPIKNILHILILTTITVCLWIGLDIYRALTKKETPEILEKHARPLDPKIDLDIVESLKGRISPSEIDFQKIPQTRKLKFETEKTASPGAEISPPG